jgi:nucleoside-diphosphate-sugar epimerase
MSPLAGDVVSWRDRRVAVTGAGGFLGGYLVRALKAHAARVTAICRGDVDLATDTLGLVPLLGEARPEVVFHLAGHTNLDRSAHAADACMRGNVQTMISLLRALEGNRGCAVVFSSSLDVYGPGSLPFREDQRERPSSPYGVSKLAAEQLLAIAEGAFGLPHVVVRLSTIYGSGQRPPKLIPAVVAASVRGERLPMGSREQRRNFLHVDDAITGLLRAAERPEALGEVINLAGDRELTVGEVVDAIRRQLGSCPEPEWGSFAASAGETTSWMADCAKAARLLDWRPTRDFATALAETVSWYRQAMSGAEHQPAP